MMRTVRTKTIMNHLSINYLENSKRNHGNPCCQYGQILCTLQCSFQKILEKTDWAHFKLWDEKSFGEMY